MALIDFFKNLFKQKQTQLTYLKVLGDYGFSDLSQWGKIPYLNDVVRAAVDTIARNAAKLNPKHVRVSEEGIVWLRSNLERVLALEPNQYMSAYDFYYKMITMRELDNNAFALIVWDREENVEQLLPIPYERATVVQDLKGGIYLQVWLSNGTMYTFPYREVIHLRKFYYKDYFLGESNKAIENGLNILTTVEQGIAEAVKTSVYLRGILKYQGILKDEDVKRSRDRFIAEYLDIQKSGGVAALDSKAEYIPIESKPQLVDANQLKILKDKIYHYFGVNDAIVTGNFNEDQWTAFYESVLEPIAIQMSLEFTRKIFSAKEIGHGNRIIFESNRLQYASVRTKTTLISQMMQLGILTINEAREILNLAPVPDGDKRLISLNYVSADKQDLYQVGELLNQEQSEESNTENK